MKRLLLSCLLATGVVSAVTAQDTKPDALPAGALLRLGTERFRDLGIDYSPRLHTDGKNIIVKDNTGATLYSVTTGLKTGPMLKAESMPMAFSDSLSHALIGGFRGISVVTVPDGKKVLELKPRDKSYSDTFVLCGDGSTVAKLQPSLEPKTNKDRVGVVLFEKVAGGGKPTKVTTIQDVSMQVRMSTDGSRAVTWGASSIERDFNKKVDPSTTPNMRFQCWDTKEGKELCQAGLPTGYSLSRVEISPKGDVVAVTAGEGLFLYDVSTGKLLRELISYRSGNDQLTFNSDGSHFAASNGDGSVSVWEVATGKLKSFVPTPYKAPGYGIAKSIVFTGKDTAVVLGNNGVVSIVWEVPSGKVLSILGDETELISAVAFANGDKEVLSFGTSGKVAKWDTTGKKLGTAPVNIKSSTYSYSTFPQWMTMPGGGNFLSTSFSESTVVYDVEKDAQVFAYPFASGFGSAYKDISRDGSIAVGVKGQSAYEDKPKPGSFSVYNAKDFLKTGEYELKAGTVQDAALSADGQRLSYLRVVSDNKSNKTDCFVTTVNTKDGQAVSELTLKYGYSSAYLIPSADAKMMYLIPPGGDKKMLPIDLETGKADKAISLPFQPSVRPVKSVDGKKLAISTQTGYGAGQSSIAVLDLESGKLTHEFQGHVKQVTSLAFSSDGKKLASGSNDTTVLVWDLTKPVEK
jgi:WD40 repeat protein